MGSTSLLMGLLSLFAGCYEDVNKPLVIAEKQGNPAPAPATQKGTFTSKQLVELQANFFTHAQKKLTDDDKTLPNPDQTYELPSDLPYGERDKLLMVAHTVSEDPSFAGGDGSKDKPYQIKTFEQLTKVCAKRQAYFVLENDIDAAGQVFQPLCPDPNEPFVGLLDGKGYRIKNLVLAAEETTASLPFGLFAHLGVRLIASGSKRLALFGRVINLTVENPSVQGAAHTGAIAGILRGKIVNCHVISGEISLSEPLSGEITAHLGGIAGRNNADAEIRYCSSSATVKTSPSAAAGQIVGGIAGSNQGIIEKCYAMGGVEGGYSVGGIVGRHLHILRRCAALNSVKGGQTKVGGLVGETSDRSIIEDSYATGAVEGRDVVGGLVGSWNNVFLTKGANDSPNVSTYIINCYASNKVTSSSGGEQLSGILGEHKGKDQEGSVPWQLSQIYWNTDITGQALTLEQIGTGGLPQGRTLNQLTCPKKGQNTCEEATTYVGWQEDTWELGSEKDLPLLKF